MSERPDTGKLRELADRWHLYAGKPHGFMQKHLPPNECPGCGLDSVLHALENYECEGCNDMEENAQRFYDEKVAAEAALEAAKAELNEAIAAHQQRWGQLDQAKGDVKRLVAERDRLAEALRAIKQNAEAWHGPPPIDPQQGHARALAVIAKTADNALAGVPGGEQTDE